MELAAADGKAGLPPSAEPAPASDVKPVDEAAKPVRHPDTGPIKDQIPAPVPLPVAGTPAPAPKVEALAPTITEPTPLTDAKSGERGSAAKELSQGTAHAAASTATKSAVIAGSVGVGAGAAVTALGQGAAGKPKDKSLEKLKDEAKNGPTKTVPAPVVPPLGTLETAAAPPTHAPVVSLVETPKAATASEKPGPTKLPATHEPEAAPAVSGPAPIPVPNQSQPQLQAQPPASPVPTDLPTLHPASDPGASSETSAAPTRASDVATSELSRPLAATNVATAKPQEALAKEGWVEIKHSGDETVRDVQREISHLDDGQEADTSTPGSSETVDDNSRSFEVESPPLRIGSAAAVPVKSIGNENSRPAKTDAKLETVLHKVEQNENFWTISRMYYNSGRYYRALWKANVDKVPEITRLYINTVIRIPPPEDLDPSFIDPPGVSTPRSRAEQTVGGGEGSRNRDTMLDESAASTKTATSSGGVPIRRLSRADAELNLPVSDAAIDEPGGTDRLGHRSNRDSIIDRRSRDDSADYEPDVRRAKPRLG